MTVGDVLKLRSDVRLEPLSLQHAETMYRWMCDPQIRANVGVRREVSLARTAEWVENACKAENVHASAVLRAGKYVGNVVLDRIDSELATARVSIYIGETSEQRAGIGTTAMHLALRQAFEQMGLHKVWLTVHARNTTAIRTYRKIGFVEEGILRDEFLLDGERLPVYYMGLLQTEFREPAIGGNGESGID